MNAATATFKQLQKDDTLLSQQHQVIADLKTFYKDYINANGPLCYGQREDIDIERDAVSSNDLYSACVADMTTFLEDIGGFVFDRMRHVDQVRMENMARNLSKGLLNLIAGLDEVVAERYSLNGVSLNVLPPVVPHEPVTMNGRAFTAIVRAQCERLADRWDPYF
ncbi:hypothetical protein PsorP6_011531 [Peronosclerospora sorghi]|uniref:Uncharacterized protein n=1 Tax=Peronosclerospora sorghi TaxID=230839 RepID=A0ACC0WKU2_9STRA|nr:hypothetical protein PsorP6_011531 [Peronosclerospora sorghi]